MNKCGAIFIRLMSLKKNGSLMKILSAVFQHLFPSLSPEVFIAQLYKAWRFFGTYVLCYSSADGTGHVSVKHCSRSQRAVAVT